MRKRTVVIGCLVGIVGAAAADPKAEQQTARQQAIDEARKAGILGPKPGAELAALAKVMAGEWTCTGELFTPAGAAVKMTGHMTNAIALDGRWLHESMDVTVPPAMHVGFEAFITFDARPKKWRRIEVDSVGNHTISSAVPTTTGKLEWLSDETNADGKVDQQRTHFDGSDPKKLHVLGDQSIDHGKTWLKSADLTCTK